MMTSLTPNEERFGFKTHGIFYCSKPTENALFYASLLIGVGSIILVGITLLIVQNIFNTNVFQWISNVFLFIAWCGISILGTIGFWLWLFYPRQYTYSADSEKFVVTGPKDELICSVYRYDDIVSVDYAVRSIFWVERGYDVTIVTRSMGKIRIPYLYNRSFKVHSIDNAPFRIIEERAELVKTPEFYACHSDRWEF